VSQIGRALRALFVLDQREMGVDFLPQVLVQAGPTHDVPDPSEW
jgi:hypothetical protein